MKVTLYGYKKCSTCMNAQKYLTASGAEVDFHDVVANPVQAATVRAWFTRYGTGAEPFINTKGTVYRERHLQLDTFDDAGWAQALHEDGRLVKRPILDTGSALVIGFDKSRYNEIFAEEM